MNAYRGRWIEHDASRGNSPVTVQNDRSTVTAHRKPVLAKHRLKNLTTKHVADLDAHVRKAGKSSATRRHGA
jgi:hypothetical protein